MARIGSTKTPPLTEAQLEIMNIVWAAGECSVNDVLSALSKHRKVARNTVLTLMTRLAEKGWLKQRKRGRGFLYTAGRQKEATQRSMARRLVEAAFGGSINGLVMALVDDAGLTEEELTAIRNMIERADGEKGS